MDEASRSHVRDEDRIVGERWICVDRCLDFFSGGTSDDMGKGMNSSGASTDMRSLADVDSGKDLNFTLTFP